MRAGSVLLALDGDDALAAEAHAAVETMRAALPDDELRRRFAEAAPIKLLEGLRGL